MTRKIIAVIAVCLSANAASAAEIWTSEAECLQRQVQLKQIEDSLKIVSLELARASLEKMPEAQIGGRISEAKNSIESGMKEMRSALKDVCSKLYP
ncbi:hypothetical protein PCC82_04920 [Agrobacterium deltaense]